MNVIDLSAAASRIIQARPVAVAVAGACSCNGGDPFAMLPEPDTLPNGRAVMPSGWQPPKALLTDPRLMRMALARGCVSEVYSDITSVAAAATETVRVQPSQGCFLVLQRKVIVVDAATQQIDVNIAMEREYIGDCPITCQNTRAYTRFLDTDDCGWCPTRNLPFGRNALNEDYHVDFTNIHSADVQVQIGLRGICYAGASCWAGFRGEGGGQSCGACGA